MFGILSDLTRLAIAPVRLVVGVAEPVVRGASEIAHDVAEPVVDVVDEVVDSIVSVFRY